MDQEIARLRVETVRGNLQGVKAALVQGVSVDQLFKTGEWNALMHACSLGHHEIVEYLLQEGADPNFHKELFTPLMAACASNIENEEKLLKCVDHLIRYNANVNAMERHRLTPLMFACKQGHVKVVLQLVANTVNLDVQDSQGWTALFWAASKEKIEIVEILVNAGANKDERDRSGGTALLIATRKGFHEIADILRCGFRKYNLENDILSESSGYPTEDDNSTASDNISRSRESQTTVISNQMKSREFAKYLALTDEEFQKLGMKHCGLRRETLELIKELQRKPWSKADDEESENNVTYVTAVKILGEFATQMSNMHATMAFIRYRFQNFPLHQPQDNKWSTASRLRCITGHAYCKSEQLFLETKFLNEYLTKLDDADVVPSEVIVEKNITLKEESDRSSTLTTIVIASACIIVLIWNTKTVFSF